MWSVFSGISAVFRMSEEHFPFTKEKRQPRVAQARTRLHAAMLALVVLTAVQLCSAVTPALSDRMLFFESEALDSVAGCGLGRGNQELGSFVRCYVGVPETVS